jgi:glutamate synthase (NADPH/NADH) large chain
MVDLIPVSAERDEDEGAGSSAARHDVNDYGMGDMLRHDAERLKALVERHHLYTGSKRARAILDNWADEVKRFVKVMPRDYARALRQMEAERLAAANVAPNKNRDQETSWARQPAFSRSTAGPHRRSSAERLKHYRDS